jgi:hypothetical protein
LTTDDALAQLTANGFQLANLFQLDDLWRAYARGLKRPGGMGTGTSASAAILNALADGLKFRPYAEQDHAPKAWTHVLARELPPAPEGLSVEDLL